MYTEHCTLYTYTVHCTPHTVHRTPFNVHRTLHTEHGIPYPACCKSKDYNFHFLFWIFIDHAYVRLLSAKATGEVKGLNRWINI